MIILQGAIHIFTEQPNSVAKSIYNGLRRQMTHLLEYETIKTSTIIQYPHAVSYFCELNLSYDYIAMTYSKKKGGTCTCKHCWKKSEPRIRSRGSA